MKGEGNILDYRSKLDTTLSLPELTSDEMIHTLVKNQILKSLDYKLEEYNEYVVERRSKQMSNFLSMLRSASLNDFGRSKSGGESHSGWKVKQDTDEFRVMYREGPEGTPLHTLLVEGYVDGPLDVCLCISSESDLYKKWWPQTSIPTFKVVSSECVQQVRTGEQISLVRMKVSWPLSSREVLVHNFVFEYFQEGLVVVLLNSISDLETIDRSTHGFTRDGIPDAQDVVRIDLVGGFALQKVTQDRSYFRTIANMDLKLDFVPPAFLNFISRQLVGSGFKLYKKEIASASQGDEKFRVALNGPLYTRIHKALYPENTSMASPPLENPRSTSIRLEEELLEASKDNNDSDDYVTDSEGKDASVTYEKVLEEIEVYEEKDAEEGESLGKCVHKSCHNSSQETTEEVRSVKNEHDLTEHFGSEITNKVCISPKVQHALGTLEKAISVFREHNSKPGEGQSDVKKGESINFVDGACEKSILSVADQMRRKNKDSGKLLKVGSTELISVEPKNSSGNYGSRHKSSNPHATETNQSKIAPAPPVEDCSHIKHIDSHSSANQTTTSIKCYSANNIIGNKVTGRKSRRSRFFCLKIMSV